MHTLRSFRPLAIALPLGAAATVAVLLAAQGADTPGDPLVAGFKSTYPASVSDAVELVTGKNGTMRYDMKLMTGSESHARARREMSPTISHFGTFRPDRPTCVTAWVRASCMAPRLVVITTNAHPPR